jgi:predicted small lipoprotein YifL
VARSTAIVLAVAAALAGCGIRGSLDAPSASGSPPPEKPTATAESGQGKKQGDAPKPHQGFILDRLLQ